MISSQKKIKLENKLSNSKSQERKINISPKPNKYFSKREIVGDRQPYKNFKPKIYSGKNSLRTSRRSSPLANSKKNSLRLTIIKSKSKSKSKSRSRSKSKSKNKSFELKCKNNNKIYNFYR